MPGQMYLVSAASGSGKTSLVRALCQQVTDLKISLSHTTRPQRSTDVQDVDYHFVSVKDFQRGIQEERFLEHATVFGHYYGTERTAVEKALQTTDVLLEIDWQGAQQIRKIFPSLISIFILPPSRAVLAQRLEQRSRDPKSVIEQRMRRARDEMLHHDEYDYLILNDSFEAALLNLQSIVLERRLRSEQYKHSIGTLLNEILHE